MYRLAVSAAALIVTLATPLALAGPVDDAAVRASATLADVTHWAGETASPYEAAVAQDVASLRGGDAPTRTTTQAWHDAAPPPTLVIDFPPLDDVDALADGLGHKLPKVPVLRAPARAAADDDGAPVAIPRAYVGHAAPGAAPTPVPVAAPPGVGLAALAVATAAAPVAASGALWSRLRRFLVLAAAAPLYTRIAKERLLDHGARERLLDAVRAAPGSSLADVARASGIARNTAVYHMFRLEREGLVSSLRNGRARLYFAPGALDQRERAPALAAVRHPMSASIAREVGATPGLDQQALCARFNLQPSLAHWHAKRLVQAGVVEQRRDGRYVRYYPGENFSAAMSG